MAQVRDVVCGMTVDTDTAPFNTHYMGQTYYFCGSGCKNAFDRNPQEYAPTQGQEADQEGNIYSRHPRQQG